MDSAGMGFTCAGTVLSCDGFELGWGVVIWVETACGLGSSAWIGGETGDSIAAVASLLSGGAFGC